MYNDLKDNMHYKFNLFNYLISLYDLVYLPLLLVEML